MKWKLCSVCNGTRRIKWQSLPAGAKDPRVGEERTCCACTGGFENPQPTK